MAKKEVKTKEARNVRLKMNVWKRLSRIKTDEDYENFSDIIEEMLNARGKKK